MGYLSASYGLDMDWLWDGYGAGYWLSAGYGLAMGWLSNGYGMATGWLWASYRLSVGWPWAGYQLSMD